MKKTLSILLLATACFSAHAAVPFTFQAGQPAKASEVNQNFTNLDQRVTAAESISVDSFTSSNLLVTTVNCPVTSVVVGVGCSCFDNSGTRNLGVLTACDIVGNGGFAACSYETVTFDPNKPGPAAKATAQCLNDGNGIASRSAPKMSADLGAVAEEMRAKLLEVESALRRRK